MCIQLFRGLAASLPMVDRINHDSAAWEGSPNLNETLLASKQSRLCFAPWVEVVVVVFVCFLVGSKCGSGSSGCGSGLRRTNRPSISVPSVRLRRTNRSSISLPLARLRRTNRSSISVPPVRLRRTNFFAASASE